MVDSKSGTEKIQGEPETLSYQKSSEKREGHKNRLEGVPTDQTWDSLNIKLNSDANEL